MKEAKTTVLLRVRNFLSIDLLKIRSLHACVSTRQAAVHLPFIKSTNKHMPSGKEV